MQAYLGILGILVVPGIAFLLSNNRKKINLRLVLWGMGLQFLFAFIVLRTPVGKPFFSGVDRAVQKLLQFSDEGAQFVFNALAIPAESQGSFGFFFAFQVLPTIIFFSSFMSILYHFGVMQWVVRGIAKAMRVTMKTSGSETLSVSADIFVGQTEAPLVIRPYITTMTNSELMAIMTAGFATIAGGVMAIYVKWLHDIPNIAGHLMAASIMSAPAALVLAKIIHPETETSETAAGGKMATEPPGENVVEAVARGATDGMKLAANVGAMLIAFVALVSCVNWILGLAGLSLQEILGWLFSPLAFSMGVPVGETLRVGSLMGEKIVLTELIAYSHLQEMIPELSLRSQVIASYALCGFANFASIGIQVGGISVLAPSRRHDATRIALKAMTAGALTSCLTASIAGLLL